MAGDEKLKNLKTTIASNILALSLLLSNPLWADPFGVTIKEIDHQQFYFIETKILKIDRQRDNQVAPLYAKGQLIKYLRKKQKVGKVVLSKFTLVQKTVDNQYQRFLFRVNVDDVKIMP